MPKLDIKNWTEGLYTDVAPYNVPSGLSGTGGGLYVMSNVVSSYKIGSLLKRPGYSIVDDTIESGKSITGLFNYRESLSDQVMLATANDATDDDTQLFYYEDGGSWTEITAAETAWANKANISVEMEHFIGECFFVGWGATDGFIAPRNYRHSTTTFGTNNTTNMPNAKFIRRYRDRLYIANTDIGGTSTPFRIYFSDVPVSGVVTWDTTDNFIDVDYNEELTGLGTNWDKLVAFTEYSAYLITNPPVVRKRVWDVGCSNHRTIRNNGPDMIWANRDGVWISRGGGYPVNVAGRVIDFIKYGDISNSFAEVVDEQYHLYIGSVTVNGVSYSNATIILDLPTLTWRLHEYNDDMTVFGRFFTSGDDVLFMGASDGDVHQLGKFTDSTLVTSDNTAPIATLFQTGALDFGSPGERKTFDRITTYSNKAMGLTLKARVIDENNQGVTDWKPLGELTKYINEFQVRPDKGHFLQIEGTENGTNEYWELMGLTIDVRQDGQAK